MASCLVISPEELKAYNELGVSMHEIQRDYLETGVLRSPAAISNKLKQRDFNINSMKNDSSITFDEVNKEALEFDRRGAESWNMQLSKALGIESNLISVEEAKQIHSDVNKKYNGESAFFTDGKVYFIKDKFDMESVVHEFSHPLIKSLSEELREKLYQDLMNDETLNGEAILNEVNELYTEDATPDSIREEVLVRALTKLSLQQDENPSSKTWLDKVMYQIKQALRKLIGKKVNVSKLNSNTTLKELSDMLMSGEVLELQKEMITSKEVIEYFKQVDEFVNKFDELNTNGDEMSSVQNMIDNIFKTVTEQQRAITENEDFFPLLDQLVNEFDTGLINQIRTTLQKDQMYVPQKEIVQYLFENHNGQYIENLEKVRQRMNNLTHSLYKVSELQDSLLNNLDSIKDLDTKDKIDRLLYYKQFIVQWGEIIDTFDNWSYGEDAANPVKKLSVELSTKSKALRDKVNSIQRSALKDAFVELIEPSAKLANDEFQRQVELKKNAPQAVRDRLYREFTGLTEQQYKRFNELKNGNTRTQEFRDLYERWLTGLEFNSEKADAILRGETMDADYANSMLESLSMNTDPLITSVYKHIQNLSSLYDAKALEFYNSFVKDVVPHMDKVGASYQNRGSVGRKLGFKDVKGKIKEDGTVEKVEEWSFLNKWKEYRFDRTELLANIQNAQTKFEESNSEVDKQALLEAQREFQLWKNKYMNQDFTVEYYEALDLLAKDEIGREASELMTELNEELRLLHEDNEGGKYDSQIENIKVRMKKLRMTTDDLGNKKTERDLEIAERLQEFQNARKDFFIEDEIPNAFESAYNEYSNWLLTKYDSDSEIYQEKLNEWLRKNTRVSLKNSVHERRQALIDEKKALLANLNAENKTIFDDTDLQTMINDLTNQVKDEGNQPDGRELEADVREKVKKAHEEIEEKRQNLLNKFGLTLAENKRYKQLQRNYYNNGNVWVDPLEKIEFEGLVSKSLKNLEKFGISQTDLGRIAEIDKELFEMSASVPTDYYKEVIDSLLNTPQLQQIFVDFAASNGYTHTTVADAYNEEVLEFVNSSYLSQAAALNPDIQTFVDQNHYTRDGKLVVTKPWVVSLSLNPFDYKTKRLKTADGKNKLIQIDGQYRIPSSQFYKNQVKDKYKTKKVVGETVDNRGNWLPKEEDTQRYRNSEYYRLQQEEPEQFAFLQALTKQYLDGQEMADNKDRLYLAFPRTRKTRLENVVTGTVPIMRRIREFFTGAEDDVLDYKSVGNQLSKDQKALASYSLLSTDVSKPVIGVYEGGQGRSIDINDISTDVLKTIPEYIASIHHKKGLQESNSYARLMQDMVNNTEIDQRDLKTKARSILRKSRSMNIPDQFAKSHKESNRSKVINALIERDLDGVMLSGFGSNNVRLQKVLNATVKRSSKINFNWNLLSGVVNYGQIKLTSYTHALAHDQMGRMNALKGEKWAFKTATKISRDIRKRDVKSLEEQMVLIFDAISGRNIDTIGDSLSRTYIGDVLDNKLSQNARHWLEMQGTLQNFGGMMYEKKVNYTKDGVTKQISYIDAFEIVEGRVQTKEGVDPLYSVSYNTDGELQTGQGFLDHKHHMQNVIMKWNGAFAKKDSPLVGRYLLAKQVLFLKKHVIPIASKHYAFGRSAGGHLRKRMNWTTGEAEYGHTIQTAMVLRDAFTSLGRSLPYMTKHEIRSVLFTLTEVMMAYVLLPMLYGLLTPMDDDDEVTKPDYTAMNRRSGYYEGLFTVDQPSYQFDLQGYALNMLSMISLKMKDEYSSVMWGLHPDGVVDFMKQSTSQSINLTQTLKYYTDFLKMVVGNAPKTPSNTTGPYFFQQKGSENGNMYRLLFRFYGWNGKMIDPVGTQRKYEQGQRL